MSAGISLSNRAQIALIEISARSMNLNDSPKFPAIKSLFE
jgi:hypothetical protein